MAAADHNWGTAAAVTAAAAGAVSDAAAAAPSAAAAVHTAAPAAVCGGRARQPMCCGRTCPVHAQPSDPPASHHAKQQGRAIGVSHVVHSGGMKHLQTFKMPTSRIHNGSTHSTISRRCVASNLWFVVRANRNTSVYLVSNLLQLKCPMPERMPDPAEAALGHTTPQVIAGQQRVLDVQVLGPKGTAFTLLCLHLRCIPLQHRGQQLPGQQQGALCRQWRWHWGAKDRNTRSGQEFWVWECHNVFGKPSRGRLLVN